jgi:hypothetical protein
VLGSAVWALLERRSRDGVAAGDPLLESAHSSEKEP